MGGEARIAGHRIRVRDIAIARDLEGLSPEEIAASVYPSLSLGEVYSALAYYEDHREEIEQATKDEERLIEEYRRQNTDLIRDMKS
jgi:uncharacterized protein (DUF433 family)